jgi:hypothetical protein
LKFLGGSDDFKIKKFFIAVNASLMAEQRLAAYICCC